MNILKRSKCLCRSRHFKNEQPSEYLKIQSRKDTNVLERYRKRTRWQRFKDALSPHLSGSKELAYAYTKAKVEKELSEALRIAEEAAEIAAKKDLIRQKGVKEFGAVIDDIFAVDSLPPGAKALKLAKLIQENPQVLEQLKIAGKVIEKFSLNNNHKNKLMVESQSYIMDNFVVENG